VGWAKVFGLDQLPQNISVYNLSNTQQVAMHPIEPGYHDVPASKIHMGVRRAGMGSSMGLAECLGSGMERGL
jgi:hypothetical protein